MGGKTSGLLTAGVEKRNPWSRQKQKKLTVGKRTSIL